ncbi:Holliday junction resolvase RuvX [Mycoplasma putrefaciens]|uniref:Putative pre-16S rRNA nuclease n=1 Tax=Mycoplasma putrefaciens (strain ATCC 15718 / NCTC 10155 / C30 KS-1 / KS-1) TaxID=743965 RepID=A0A7U3ZSX0_MYCPK|nr:Holliday junction resolvase RuvX [Mycoplasma putrefaciens]AEM68930.1 putative Holliday junction resolvase [Mycoplasma putrefaciens KS1]
MKKVIALDVGSKTIGLAYSSGIIASPLSTIRFDEWDFDQAIEKLAPFLNQYQPEIIVFGYPKNMNNTIGERARMVDHVIELFLKKYSNYSDQQITRIDERRTTAMAKNIMIQAGISRKKQKQNKDGLAAQLILEMYLNTNK